MSPSAPVIAAAADAAAASEQESALSYLRNRLSAADALVQVNLAGASMWRRSSNAHWQELKTKAHKADVAFSQERSVLVKKVIELQVRADEAHALDLRALTLTQGLPDKVRMLQVRAVAAALARRC